jgi:hypothetical protein
MPLKGNGNEADFLIFYLMLIFSDFATDHGLINYIETKAKGCHLKKFTCKGTLRQVFIIVYRLELHFNHMLVFLTQLCEVLTLPSPHPLPSVNKYKVCIHYTVCKGGLRQINTCRKVSLQVNFLDDDILLWCQYTVVSWSMLQTFPSSEDGQIQINTGNLYKIFSDS